MGAATWLGSLFAGLSTSATVSGQCVTPPRVPAAQYIAEDIKYGHAADDVVVDRDISLKGACGYFVATFAAAAATVEATEREQLSIAELRRRLVALRCAGLAVAAYDFSKSGNGVGDDYEIEIGPEGVDIGLGATSEAEVERWALLASLYRCEAELDAESGQLESCIGRCSQALRYVDKWGSAISLLATNLPCSARPRT